LLIGFRPDDAGAYVVAQAELDGGIGTLRDYAQRLLHVRRVEADRKFFAPEVDVERLAGFTCFRTRR
jgi:hypothetical protein